MKENIKVKAKFKGTSRRFEILSSITWNDLVKQLRQLFEIEEFRVKYCDDESELVSLSSQDELNEAIRLCKQSSKLLHLNIEDSSSNQTTDSSLLELEKRNVQKKTKTKKNSDNTSCYADLASAMASELAALNSRMEKSTPKLSQTENTQECEDKKMQHQPKVENDKKKESCGASCYADLASAAAPELAALNERLSKASLNDKQAKKPPEKSEAADSTTAPSASKTPESCYINLEEVLAQSREKENSDLKPELTDVTTNTTEGESQASPGKIGASRGWFEEFEQYQGQQDNAPSVTQTKGKKKKKHAKKQGCYYELAEAIAPDLAKLTVKDVPTEGGSSDSSNKKVDVLDQESLRSKEDALTLNEPASKFNSESKRPLDQSGNQYVKKTKRPKKHSGENKNCYIMMAEDIAPFFGAMNKRLEEKQKQQKLETLIGLQDQAIPSAPEHEVPLYTSPPESPSNEPFVFVSHEGIVSIEAGTGKGDESEVPPNPDVISDFESKRSLEQTSGQNNEFSAKPNLISFDEEKNVAQAPEEENKLRMMMKKVLDESMDTILNEAVERLQIPKTNIPAVPCNTPQGQATPLGVVVHKGITCDNCSTEIHGIRYKCGNCQDFDLCETCEELPGIHNIRHVFVKLRFPAPGIGHRHGEMVPIFKKCVYKKDYEKKQKEKELRRAAKEADKERKKAIRKQKHFLRAQEKERKKKEKAKKVEERQEPSRIESKIEVSNVHKRLQASLIRDTSVLDCSIVSPGQKFGKTWLLKNEGDIAWNQWITLECIEGSIVGFPSEVPHLKPGASDDVSVEFVAPEVPGTYFSKWQLSYGLHTFGPHLCCEIQVLHHKEDENQVHHDQHSLVDTAFKLETPPVETNVKLDYETKLLATNMDDGSSSEYLSSEDTPDPDPAMLSSSSEQKEEISYSSSHNKTSFTLIGQQRQDLEWDAGCTHDLEIVHMDPDDMIPQRKRRLTDNWSIVDSEADTDGEESDSSLDEFTVLIPTCFDPDAPLTADPVPVLVTSTKQNHSFSSSFLNLIEHDSQINLDDGGPSSLPNLEYTSTEKKTPSKDNHPPVHKDRSPAVKDDDKAEEPKKDVATATDPICAPDVSSQETVSMETPVSRQPSMTPPGSIPLVTQPTTVETRHYRSSTSDNEMDSNNLVSEVLNSAIDAVTMAGRAAFATVDNLINGGVQGTAKYKPEDECEVTVTRSTDMDAPPPPPLIWPVNRPASTSPMDRLIEMGFCDRKLNQRLLHKHKDDLQATINELLGHLENDWSSQRH